MLKKNVLFFHKKEIHVMVEPFLNNAATQTVAEIKVETSGLFGVFFLLKALIMRKN